MFSVQNTRSKQLIGYFLVSWLAVSLAASLVWLDTLRGYAAELSVLVLEKNGTGQVAGNLVELSKNLSFYDAVLSRNELIIDTLHGESPDRRKAGWQKRVQVARVDESGLLAITAWGEDRDEARLLADATAATLFATAARYYNVKTDLDLRLVDGPYVGPRLRSVFELGLASVGTGLAITGLFFVILAGIDRLLLRAGARPLSPKRPAATDMAEAFKPIPPAHWTFDERRTPLPTENGEEPRKASDRSPVPASTAAAPPNLPILESAEPSLSPLQGAMARLVKEDIDATVRAQAEEPSFGSAEIQPRIEEPSSDEYKRRLNELLSGRMK